MRTNLLVTIASVSLALSGCSSSSSTDSTDTASSEAALDSNEVTSDEGAVITSAVSTSASGASAAAIAADLSTKWATQFTPAGCATATASGPTVKLVANDCSGPYGLVHVDGEVDVTITPKLTGYAGSVKSSDFKVNGATMSIDSSFVYTDTSGSQSLTVQSSGSGTGSRGRAVSHTGDYTVTWSGSCLALDGTWSTTYLAVMYTTTVTSYKVCEGACPMAGGAIAFSGAGRTLDISFDGTDDATYTSGSGKGGDVMLACGQ